MRLRRGKKEQGTTVPRPPPLGGTWQGLRLERERKGVELFGDGIKGDEQLTHDGGDGDLERFAAFNEAFVEGAKRGVETAGGKGSHVEGATHGESTSVDGPLSAVFAAIAADWRQPGQRGDLILGERAQFGTSRQKESGRKPPHALDCPEVLDLGLKALAMSKECFDLFLASIDLPLEVLDMGFDGGNAEGMVGLPEAFDLIRAHGNKGLTPRGKRSQFFIDGIRRRSRGGLHPGPKISKDFGIKLVSLGQNAASASEVTSLARIEHTQEDAFAMKSASQSLVIIAGALADELEFSGSLFGGLDQRPKPGRGIWNGGWQPEIGAEYFDGIFGDISADVDNRGKHG